ncbi:MAG: hypothetical protein J6Y58_09300 [Clostridiales bacterium]|nr:hypothetical protein [Clostridiales bacterium]
MAKFLENDNESPEVDLKNLTVKLAGMGLDEEIEDVIPGKNDTKDYKTADDADESKDESEKNEDAEELTENDASEEESAESEEVNEFYEKRAAERDLTLEKVEELAEEMESSDAKKQKVSTLDTIIAKSEKKQTEKKDTNKKKQKKLDGLALVGIILAIAALVGGGIWLYRSSNQEPNLNITLNMFFKQYRSSKIYGSIFQMGFDCPEPSYRTEEEMTVVSSSDAAEPAATTAIKTSKYRYFDFVVSGRVREGIQEPVFVSGSECKDNNYLKNIRFFAPMKDDSDLQVYYVVYSAFLQAFYTDERSEVCLDKVKNAYSQSLASTETAVMVKDGDLAYSVTKAQIDGTQYFVMDIVPSKEADKFVFATKMYQEPNLRMTERSFRALYYSSPLYADVLLQFGFQFRGVHYAGEPYQETAAQASAEATPTPVPTPIPSSTNTKYRFFDNASIGSISQDWPIVNVSIVGCENKSDHFMRWVRFYAPLEMENDAEIDVYAILYGAFIQSLYSGTDSNTCLKKVQNTFLDFYNSEDKTPKMVKDGHLAYSVRIEEIDGQRCFVMDVVPVEEADTFNFSAPYSN